MGFFIEALVGCIITLVGFWFMSDVLFEKKSNKNLKDYIVIIIYSVMITLLNIIGNNHIDKTIKIIVVFVLMLFFNKNKYKNKISDTILGTFLVYLNFYLAEIIVGIILIIATNVLKLNVLFLLKFTIIGNTLISITSFFIIHFLKPLYMKILKNIKYYDLNLICATIIILIILAILLTKTPVEKWTFSIDFITTVILILMFCFIGIYMIKQKSEIDTVIDKYIKLAEYAKNNEGLLEEYRMNLHENRNRLITIDNMVPKKYKEVHEYIGELIKKNKSNKYYWLTELKYIPSSELKGFMNYKIMEMINDKLDIEVNISRELDKKIIKNYNVKDKEELYSIVGIFLDNAYEASKISKEKSVSIQMFMEKKDLKLIIANTYKGKIDLEKIDEYGYSSKGTNRGTGLHIVSEIVSRNSLFEKETSILDDYFVQTLTLHPKKSKKKKS